jgi:hypothetical protein
MRVLVGLCPIPDSAERKAHIDEVVDLFVRAYRPAEREKSLRARPAMPARDRRVRP